MVAAQPRGVAQEAEDQVGGFRDVSLSIGLFLGPTCAGYEEEFSVWPNRLCPLLRRAQAGDGGADCRQFNRNLLDGCSACFGGKGGVGTGIQKKEPGA